jgi:hypothetical protein
MKHDTYSRGTVLDMNIAIPNTNGSICQYVAVVKRNRARLESSPTSAELYSILSLAAMFREQKTHAGDIKVRVIADLVSCLQANRHQVRLFIVHSCRVQILSATAPLSYIMSILEGTENIEGSLDISESPWFNLVSLPSLEQLLLSAFESTILTKHERIPEMFLNRTALPQASKRKMEDSDSGAGKKKVARN